MDRIEQVRTIFGEIIDGVKDRLDGRDELLIARIDRHRKAIEANLKARSTEIAA